MLKVPPLAVLVERLLHEEEKVKSESNLLGHGQEDALSCQIQEQTNSLLRILSYDWTHQERLLRICEGQGSDQSS